MSEWLGRARSAPLWGRAFFVLVGPWQFTFELKVIVFAVKRTEGEAVI